MTADSSLNKLILLSPNLVTQPAVVEALLNQHKTSANIDHQVLDRLSAVKLKQDFYNEIHLAGNDAKLPESIFEELVAALVPGGLFIVDSEYELLSQYNLSALLAGFVETKITKGWQKPNNNTASSITIPLKRTNQQRSQKSSIPQFKRASEKSVTNGIVQLDLNDDDDDDLIDENDLITHDLSSTIQIPDKCKPSDGKRRKKACKDCTCGLKEVEEQELEQQRQKQENVVSLSVDDTAEVDFTVPGKATGSCGSCALGDAFRCDGCPYLGLPPFKPGEVVSVAALGDDDL